ncbi:MAG: hydrogenase maturation protease [Candidatus Sulfotelmatobacter sp.]|jgi:hydrogenase maturation protease
MPRVLIVAYGNPLRSDDGVGWMVADDLRRKLASPEVEVLQLTQLLPEIAQSISHAKTVIFVDASCEGEPGELHCRRVTPPPAKVQFTHQLSPAELLGLAGRLYGATPQAFCVSLTGQCFEHGQELSKSVASRLPELASKVEQLTNRVLR